MSHSNHSEPLSHAHTAVRNTLHRSRRVLQLSLFALILLMLAACGGAGASPASDGSLDAVVTTGMVADVVKNVGGEHIQVTALMGPGVDPHLYKATESDVSKLSDADILFYNGLNLEARMVDIFEQIGRNKPAIVVTSAIPAELILTSPHYQNQPDPHVWMDPKRWSYTIDVVRDSLIELDPDHAADYTANAAAYHRQVEELASYVKQQVDRVPAERRVLITAHDAFQYFGDGFDYEVFAPQGISTASEAGVDDIRRVIDLAVERDIPAIFVESSVPPDVVEAIVAGAKDRGHELVIGGQLYSDAMGDPATPEGTYIGMIRRNVDTIVAPVLL